MTYNHVSNLRVPLDGLDLALLSMLTDYRLGPPCAASHETARSQPVLAAAGVVGLYITREEFETNQDFRRKTGWRKYDPIIGRDPLEWAPLS